jgi:hypothetical protein
MFILLCLSKVTAFSVSVDSDMSTTCPHQYWSAASAPVTITDQQTVYKTILANQTHYFYYENTTLSHSYEQRKLMINLEPCYGSVRLYIRRTWPCFPNPYKCLDTSSTTGSYCEWTDYQTDTSEDRAGAPTMFILNQTSTRYYMAVFAEKSSHYTLQVVTDIIADNSTSTWNTTALLPYPGNNGQVTGTQTAETSVQISWSPAPYATQYLLYAQLMLNSDTLSNKYTFIKTSKVLNTVCGLTNNTDGAYLTLSASSACNTTTCIGTVSDLMLDSKYAFNVVGVTANGLKLAYSGMAISTSWEVSNSAISEKTMSIISAVLGGLLGIIVMGYIWLQKVYQ